MALFVAATALALSPWVIRNYAHFGRIIVTSQTGPANAWLGNHPGASGGEDVHALSQYKKWRRQDPEKSGYRLAWEFALRHPRQEAALLWKKLKLTYGRDDGAVALIRGVNVPERRIPRRAEQRLRAVANAFWWVVFPLAGLGLLDLRRWPPLARVIVLGVPASWLLVHLVFIGGARFHVPETPSLALAAAAGGLRLRAWAKRALPGVW